MNVVKETVASCSAKKEMTIKKKKESVGIGHISRER
jgi:hypothetical protein